MNEHDNYPDNFGQALAVALQSVTEDGRWFDSREVDAVRDELLPNLPPIDMVLFCPKCHTQHIDAPDLCKECPGGNCMCVTQAEKWTNPPHRSHLCNDCKHVWRPADVPTNGVKAVKTKGKNDTPPPEPLNMGDMLDSGGIWK